MLLPSEFVQSISNRLSEKEMEAFLDSLRDEVPTSIRIHPKKYTERKPNNPINWCDLGYYLDERPIFTLDPSFHGGAYYVQEASSMSIYHILNQIINQANKDNIKILDLCAAPGGKSSLIANFLDNKGLLVSNEIIKNRAYTLKYNISKEGYSNIIVTNNEPKDFSHLINFFDVILIDAPCSGEGMFRKNSNAIQEWSLQNVETCGLRQENILEQVIPCLKPGGHIIYSTCTYNDHENIHQVDNLIEKHGFESLKIGFQETWNIREIQSNKGFGYQFLPHLIRGEGFFISLLQKPLKTSISEIKFKFFKKNLPNLDKAYVNEVQKWIKNVNISLITDKTNLVHAINENVLSDAIALTSYLRLIYCGISVGQFNKSIFIPDHSLALSLSVADEVNAVEVSKQDALLFLKKELHAVDSDKKSWILIKYQGLNIGWAKNLGNRINNYLPNEYKIRMNLDISSQ